mmetsp:Transcript_10716/g.23255  ORF Transcript_10716/g.23255 Transcript_10716/m.23255 type:complete len:234 (-) Transcript_10716:1111-1812(-)
MHHVVHGKPHEHNDAHGLHGPKCPPANHKHEESQSEDHTDHIQHHEQGDSEIANEDDDGDQGDKAGDRRSNDGAALDPHLCVRPDPKSGCVEGLVGALRRQGVSLHHVLRPPQPVGLHVHGPDPVIDIRCKPKPYPPDLLVAAKADVLLKLLALPDEFFDVGVDAVPGERIGEVVLAAKPGFQGGREALDCTKGDIIAGASPLRRLPALLRRRARALAHLPHRQLGVRISDVK